jgi:Zinc knuckle
MVLGAMGSNVPVCYYCNKPGHLKADCYKYHNDLQAGRTGNGGRRGGRTGNHNGGRGAGGR